MEKNPAIEMNKVSKEFPGTLAVDEVDFDVYAGEVHALVGENGAGKSTLMRIIAGLYNDYTGQIKVDGEEIELHSPAIAKQKGIGMIYQELSLAMPISIKENLLVGRLPVNKFFLNEEKMIQQTKLNLDRVGLGDLNPELTIEEISQHEAQLVEIAKVLSNNPKIIVMDEPTSALSREEVNRLFKIIERLKQSGMAVIYISHHLPEIFTVADRVTVLRDGKKIATKDIEDVSSEELVEMMVGHQVDDFYVEREGNIGEKRLTVNHLTRFGFFHDISFAACEGEILGIVGLAGAGRTELARSMCGLDPVDGGEVFVEGKEITPDSLTEAINSGLGYLTENRKKQGLFLRLSMQENILSTLIPRCCNLGIYTESMSEKIVRNMIDKLDIVPSDPSLLVSSFSGGNQQKILMGKWLAIDPRVLILDEPTRGVDVGAKKTIHDEIRELADNGTTIILISSDLPEMVMLSDRVMVMRNGHFIGEIQKENLSEEGILLAANGEGVLADASR